ncbi:hypothetical protein SAMN04490243_2373 [Robiginitalea myxolifaciens]|uniref:Adhesin domain-containing protein n=1 Tax=Robiginitalea myxolifaciens TaxID=400055 RepID=A0A1I6H7S5_9FLAO|nr:hypothetical protein [Robiginitalea myxolifaciens]SFR50401.1 hypothetical protein SAMN04490243_2373 [Robiginitalea myxolifaciens]
MKQLRISVHKALLIGAIFAGGVAFGQQSKTYSEKFDVDSDVEVNLNTSHTDIEFETWNRNEVQVEAIITLEGASEEEAAQYFEDNGIEIMGNSAKITVSTRSDSPWGYRFNSDMDFDFEMPEIEIPEINIPEFEMPEIAQIIENLEIPELMEMEELTEIADLPPMPAMPRMPRFDHEAYERDGEEYMKKWKAEMKEGFDEDFQKRMEEWAKRAEERNKALQERLKVRSEERKARMEARSAEQEQRIEELMRRQEELHKNRAEHREQAQRLREQAQAQLAEARERLRSGEARTRAYYFQGAGKNRNFTIKKTIKIKMPKGARLKLNVRHGEVKLADNAVNIKADLNYATLLASTIEGENTRVIARYSPISVGQWRSGKLNAEFSDNVQLDLVRRLNLSANSSDVTITRLLQQASIENNLGVIRIGSISDDFKEMKVMVQNGDFSCDSPGSAYRISLKNNQSSLDIPTSVVWDKKQAGSSGWKSGYSGNKDAAKSILIDASYSKVAINE